MYKEIEIHNTDEKDKFLFIKNNNLIYGGFVIRDIILLLKQDNSKLEICSMLSEKYQRNINLEIINDIIDNKLQKLFLNPKKVKA